ncbi:MAG: hypothetical protein ABI042_10915 [Verrucomicrobiota bacterium]
MKSPHRLKFTGTLQNRRPGLRSWLIFFTILCAAGLIPVLRWPAAIVLFLFFVPAAAGSLAGWLAKSIGVELKTAARIFK